MMRGHNKQLLGLTAGLSMALLSTTASAGIIYNWKTLTTSDALTSVSGQLEVSDQAWRQGSANWNLNVGDWPIANSPIGHFSFQTNGASQTLVPANEYNGFEGQFRGDLAFSHGDTVSGSLYANNTDTEVALSGSNGIWSITEAGSDNPDIGETCFFDHGACTATGQWLVDPSTLPMNPMATSAAVAEPTNLGLFGLGFALIALGTLRRRARSLLRPLRG